jgi:hypothetical protein
MVKKRDIGKVFSDTLQDFEQAPPNADMIWEQITTELDLPKEKDKAAPIWWRGAGLGILAIGLIATFAYFGTDWFGNATDTNQEQITNQDPGNSNDGDGAIIQGGLTDANLDPNQTSNQELTTDATLPTDTIDLADTQNSGVSTNSVNSDLNSTNPNNTNPTNKNLNNTAVTGNSNNKSLVNKTETTNAISITDKTSNNQQNTTKSLTKPIANQNSQAVTNASVKNTNTKNSSLNNEQNLASTAVTNASNSTALTNNQDANTVENTALNTKKVPARGYYIIKKSSLKKQGITGDSYWIAQVPKSGELAQTLPVLALTYDNLVKIKKSKAMRALEREIRTREALDYKWTIGAVVAPTTYGSVTRGSMLDARLVDNPRKGETNLSYGIKVKNQFTPKSALRFGLNKINLGYNTQNFQVNVIDGIVNIYQLTGIDPGREIADGISLNAEATEFFATNDVVGIDQQISYIEFPLEYEYAFINSRFGANLIGGSSLIVLNDNRIFATSQDGQNLEVGAANSLTGLGYTLNLGLGLDYEISKNIQFNIDPIFKLQLNSPNNTTTNNFRPYYFGIYSGLSFKF